MTMSPSAEEESANKKAKLENNYDDEVVAAVAVDVAVAVAADNDDKSNNNLESMRYTNDGGKNPRLKVLDQLLVPHEKVYIDVPDVKMAYTVIKTMQIRGV
jgi:hypothetical protein